MAVACSFPGGYRLLDDRARGDTGVSHIDTGQIRSGHRDTGNHHIACRQLDDIRQNLYHCQSGGCDLPCYWSVSSGAFYGAGHILSKTAHVAER